MLACSHHELSAKQKHRRYELNRLSYLHAPLGAIHGEANSRAPHNSWRSQFIESAVRHFLVVDANPTVILERSEGSKSEMRETVLFLPA